MTLNERKQEKYASLIWLVAGILFGTLMFYLDGMTKESGERSDSNLYHTGSRSLFGRLVD